MTAGGILTGPEICKQVADGFIRIDPWAPDQLHEDRREGDGPSWSEIEAWEGHKQVQSASYDLRLGNKVAVYQRVTSILRDGKRYDAHDTNPDVWLKGPLGELVQRSHPEISRWLEPNPMGVLDSKKKQPVWEFDMDPVRGWLCKPGIGYLMHTSERILTTQYVPVIDGKSSIGRLFTTAHVTAGYGDAGFNGQYTLEVTVTHPTIIFPGMFFCQIRFHTQVGKPKPYRGHYTDSASMGPVASMTYKQFEEDGR